MNRSKRNRFNAAGYFFSIALTACLFFSIQAGAATMNDYCIAPPFVTQSVPPLVMFEMGRNHKLYYEAYNDASDLDEDGKIDITYKHTIDYYGYFDPYKCYTYSSSGTGEFDPVSVTSDKFCSSGQWSGNVLNWLNMSRMDSLKKVLYGGHRVTDSGTATVLERDIMPGDAHSWGKELTGRLCYNNSTSTYTYACESNSDCASGEICVDKSVNLIGIAASDPPYNCSVTGAVSWSTNAAGAVRVARYFHNSSLNSDIICGADTAHSPSDPVVARGNFLSSFDPVDTANFIDQFLATDFDDARLDPAADHYDNYNIVAVSDFNVTTSTDKNSTWQFLVDGDDPVEVEIGVAGSSATTFTGGSVIASYYGCHSECFPAASFVGATTSLSLTSTPALCKSNQLGTYKPGSTGYHRVIVRQSERTGQDGAKLWYRKSATDTWKIFPSGLATRTPDITSSNVCTIESKQFVSVGTPQTTGSNPAKRHLFCGTNLAANQPPILRTIINNSHRKWEWASKENPVCQNIFQDGQSTGTITDYTVRVKVCDSSVGLESNCKNYSGTYKPIGLLQKYGEGDGSKVCSRVFTKACNSDSDCNIPTEGMCVDKSGMLFGFMTTSYTNNTSGGVLRKNFGSITDETNINNGIFQTSENVQGNIIITFDRLSPTVGYDFTNHNYTAASGGTCGWITDGPISNGECRMWGNPIAEMMYESLRYMVGKGTPTAAFDYSGSQDSGLSLSHPDWGYNKGSSWYQPYEMYPPCARPFMLLLSDVNTSFDNDQLPGAYNSSFVEDSATPMLNINVSTLADIIGDTEGITNHNWFIGESNGTANDFVCSSKPVTHLSQIDGICPFEPTKKGSYYAAAVAYYAKTQMKGNTGTPNADTFVVALDSPLANLKVKAGSNYVNILPLGKSVSGGSDVRTNCANRCTLSYDADTGLSISNCTSNAFCPTNQVVDIYVDDIKYDSSNNVVYANYRINFEDVEQGADHDMDAIVQYEICTSAAVASGYGTCGVSLASGEIQVKVTNVYGAGGIDQVLGFIISGTTSDGVYLVVKDGDVPNAASTNTPAVVAGLPKSWSKIFTTTGTPAGVLKNPLWYAAKWGGFEDSDGDNKPYTSATCGTSTPDPGCREWDKDGDGVPDNYFLVANPLKLEDQLNKALLAILKRASSGTAASVLASSDGSGASLVQAIFYPKKMFDAADTELSWVGTLQDYWYFVDPYLGHSTILEDTNEDRVLTMGTDHVADIFFDNTEQRTKANLYDSDIAGGSLSLAGTVYIEDAKNLWESGLKLWKTPSTTCGGGVSPPNCRNIYTNCDLGGSGSCIGDTGLASFSTANKTILAPYLNATGATSDAESESVIRYVRGEDTQTGGNFASSPVSGFTPDYRNRTTGIDLNKDGTISGSAETPKVWKLGDIVNSTPKIVSRVRNNKWDLAPYYDMSYANFISTATYQQRNLIVGGANDGMFHAMKLGYFQTVTDGTAVKAKLCDDTDHNGVCSGSELTADTLGSEQWAFIPKNTLPYLKYLADKDYCHIYYLDATPYIIDASIGIPTSCTEATDYWKCPRQTKCGSNAECPDTGGTLDKANTSWRTVLIGSMRLGGACKKTGDATCADCVKTPITDPADSTKGLGYSSYFALDITDTASDPSQPPKLLWEFSDPALGLSTSGPAVVKIKSRVVDGTISKSDGGKNGRWFVVIGSGPTGHLDTSAHEFQAKSDQNLKLFILDLKGPASGTWTLNTDYWVKDTGLTNAFSGGISNGYIDFDHDFQDDVLYFGYAQKCTNATAVSDHICTLNTWTDGGVLRLITRQNLAGGNVAPNGDTAMNPANWQVSSVISHTGPVFAGIGTASYKPMGLTIPTQGWLFFGSGRYYYKGDDLSNQRYLVGLQDPCFANIINKQAGSSYVTDTTCNVCGTASPCDATETTPAYDATAAFFSDKDTDAGLHDATIDIEKWKGDVKNGWFIKLEHPNLTGDTSCVSETNGLENNCKPTAERVITDPVVAPYGAVFYTTFLPSANVCDYGGTTYLWGIVYNTGGSAAALGLLKGKAIMQVSTGEIASIDLSTAFNNKIAVDNPETGPTELEAKGRRDEGRPGSSPEGDGLLLIAPPPPLSKILNMWKK